MSGMMGHDQPMSQKSMMMKKGQKRDVETQMGSSRSGSSDQMRMGQQEQGTMMGENMPKMGQMKRDTESQMSAGMGSHQMGMSDGMMMKEGAKGSMKNMKVSP